MLFAVIVAIVQVISAYWMVIQTTKGKNIIATLFESFPMIIFLIAILVLFGTTEWAQENPGLGLLFLTPGYSIVASRQIVCNFTKMKMDPFPKSFLWFFLFPLNRLFTLVSLGKSSDEESSPYY